MRKIFISAALMMSLQGFAQPAIYPAPKQSRPILITNAEVHTGTGQVLKGASVYIVDGKIAAVGNVANVASNARTLDASGKSIYPGAIMAASRLGLREIGGSVRGSNDFYELGDLNPNVKSIVSYNTDSRIINVIRQNGILLANVYPSGNLLTGTSSTVQLDAWTWEDALYKENVGLHFMMPSLLPPPERFRVEMTTDPLKQAWEKIEAVKTFLRQAKVYSAEANGNVNLKLEAAKPLFTKAEKLFVHCNTVKQMLLALDFKKEFGIDVVIVGGVESFQIADILKQNNVPVILLQLHMLPTSDDDDIDQTFKTPAMLQKAGVLFAITDENGETTGRNLIYNAGTAAAYGLDKEEALKAITLNPAKILGIDGKTGSIEVGKDANLLVVDGDLLDMRSSVIRQAFIQGREIELRSHQTELRDRYEKKMATK